MKANRILSGILISISGIRVLLEHPDFLAFLLGINSSFSLLPGIIQTIVALGFLLLVFYYRRYDWNKEITVLSHNCWYDEKNKFRSIMIDEELKSDLSFEIGIGPAVKRWGIRITTTDRCCIQKLKNIRSEYAPEINTDGTRAWVHGHELEDEIQVSLELIATKVDSSPNAIITLEKITNEKLDLLLTDGLSWEDGEFDFLWRETVVVI